MQPRDVAEAARVVSTLTIVGGVVTTVFAAVSPTGRHVAVFSVLLTVLLCAVVVTCALGLRRVRSENELAWAVFPFAAIGVIITLDLVTHDATASAQVFFFFPALYAASQLRRNGAAALGAAAVLGDLLVVFSQLPARTALVEGGYLAAAVITTVALLVRAGERQEELVGQLQRQAAIDPLTGLVTRRVLDNAAHSALTGAASERGTALILIDVDRFKAVNDEYGHPAGDEVLIQLGRLLMLGTRPSDTVSRMGGDEIALLLAGCSAQDAVKRAEQILWNVRAHPFTVSPEVDVAVSVSVGLAHVPTHASDLRSLYAAADASLYAAKRAGRDRVGDTVTPPPAAPTPGGRRRSDRGAIVAARLTTGR